MDLVFIKTLDNILDSNLVSSLAFNKEAIWFHCLENEWETKGLLSYQEEEDTGC
jgi:hypothetical protein